MSAERPTAESLRRRFTAAQRATKAARRGTPAALVQSLTPAGREALETLLREVSVVRKLTDKLSPSRYLVENDRRRYAQAIDRIGRVESELRGR